VPARVAGIHVEDQLFLARTITSSDARDEFVLKLKYSERARNEVHTDFVIIWRVTVLMGKFLIHLTLAPSTSASRL
jgi:hypothetical protein